MQESWLMFMKGDLIKVHSLNVQVIFTVPILLYCLPLLVCQTFSLQLAT